MPKNDCGTVNDVWPKNGRELAVWRGEMTDYILEKSDVSPFQKLVWIAIVRRVNAKTGEAWPSHGTLAEAIAGTTDGVRGAIRELAKQGCIQVSPGVGRHSSRYRTGREGCGQRTLTVLANAPIPFIDSMAPGEKKNENEIAEESPRKILLGHTVRPKRQRGKKSSPMELP